MLQDSGIGKDFLDKTPKTQEIKAKLDKCNYIKLKGCTAKETIRNVKTATDWEKVRTNCAPGSPKELKNSLPKWAAHKTDISQKKTHKWHTGIGKKRLTPSIIRKFKSKPP